jgi:hypothetical protein
MKRLTAALLTLLAAPALAAGIRPLGESFPLSDCATCQNEVATGLAGARQGGFYALWSASTPATSFSAYGRAFGPDGLPAEPVRRFGDDTKQADCRDVGVDRAGRFTVLWLHPGQIWLQRMDRSGTPRRGAVLVNGQPTSQDDDRANLGVDRAGFAIVTFFANNSGQPPGFFSRAVSPTDEVAEARQVNVDSAVAQVGTARLAALGREGKFYVLWETRPDPQAPSDLAGPRGLAIRGFDRQGEFLGPEVEVLPPTGTVFSHFPDLVADPKGEFLVVAWQEETAQHGSNVMARWLTPDLAPMGRAIRLSRRADGDQRAPRLAFTPAAELIAVWEVDDGNSATLMGRRVRRDGRFRGKERPLADSGPVLNPAFPSLLPKVAAIGRDDRFVVVWMQGGRVFGRRFEGAP